MEANPPYCKGSGHRTMKDFYLNEPEAYSSYFKWCFVRNPWDRAVSAWDTCPEIKPYLKTFPEFVDALYKDRKKIQNLSDCRWGPSPLGGGAGTLAGQEGVEINLPVQRIHFLPMLSMMKVDGVVEMDFIGRFENIQQDWNKVTTLLFDRPIKLPEHNRRPNTRCQVETLPTKWSRAKTHYQQYYTHPDLVKKIADIYSEDIEAFGYTYDKFST